MEYHISISEAALDSSAAQFVEQFGKSDNPENVDKLISNTKGCNEGFNMCNHFQL